MKRAGGGGTADRTIAETQRKSVEKKYLLSFEPALPQDPPLDNSLQVHTLSHPSTSARFGAFWRDTR